MKLLDVLSEGSADLERVKDIFLKKWKNVMSSKGRQGRVSYAEDLVKDLLSSDEVRLLALKLQRK